MVRARNRTPSLKVAAFDDDVDDYDDASISNLNANSSSKEDTGKEQGGVVRGLAFDGDSSADDGDDDDSSVSSIDSSSSDDDDDDGSELRLEEVKPFDVDKGSSSSLRLGRSRSVHFDLAASGTPSRQSRESANGGDDGEGSDSARAADARARRQRQQQRRSPLSAFAEGEMWLASSTRLSTVGLRKRDVIHDDLFYICFDEVCQTAIHKQMQRRRRGRAASTQSTFETDREKERERERQQATGPAVAMAVAGDGNGRGNGPGRTRSRSTPEVRVMSVHARDDITGDGNSDGDGPAAVRARAWEEEKKEEKGSRGMIAAGVRVASAKGRGEQDAAAGSGDDAAPPPPKRPGGAWVPPHRRRRNVSVSFADDSKKPAAVT